jgi:hypothetical protein
MVPTMTVYRCNRKHYEDNDVWYDTLVEWNELPKKKYFAAMISDLQKRINDWNKFNVDSQEAAAEESKAKKDALWKWNQTKGREIQRV